VLCVGPLDSWEHPLAALKLAAALDEHDDGNLALLTEMCGRSGSANYMNARHLIHRLPLVPGL